jgi:hypothetical protein
MRELGVLKIKNFRRSTSERKKKNQNWRHCRKAGCKADLNQKGKEKGTYKRNENKPKIWELRKKGTIFMERSFNSKRTKKKGKMWRKYVTNIVNVELKVTKMLNKSSTVYER